MTATAMGCAALAAIAAIVAACTSSPSPAPLASHSAPPASTAPPVEPRERGADEILPVYPADAGAPEPLAERFCDVVYSLPERRRAECCPGAFRASMRSECVRTLSVALRDRAVEIAPSGLDACADAMTEATLGCDWVVGLTAPLPPACDGLLQGKLPEKAKCRSSLECAGSLRCQGLSTIDVGACGPPKAAPQACNLANDMLATFTRQDHLDRAHPECDGWCARSRCREAIPVGGACDSDIQCGKHRCSSGKCTDAPLRALGEPCTGDECLGGSKCVKGKCAAPKAENEPCEENAECRGACERPDGGATGSCQKTCNWLQQTPIPPLVKPAGPKPAPRKR